MKTKRTEALNLTHSLTIHEYGVYSVRHTAPFIGSFMRINVNPRREALYPCIYGTDNKYSKIPKLHIKIV